MNDQQNQKSLKSRVNDELNALRKQEIAKNRRGNFKDEGSTFLTPEEAQTYLAELRLQKKTKEQPKPPTNLPSSELNDWYSRQRKMHLDEQKKRVEAEKFLRGYRSKLDHVNNMTNSPKRTKNDDVEEDNYVPTTADIEEDGIENVMLEVSKFESKVPMTTLKMKAEKMNEKFDVDEKIHGIEDVNKDDINDDIKEEKNEDVIVEDKDTIEEEEEKEASPDLNGNALDGNKKDLDESEEKTITELEKVEVKENDVEGIQSLPEEEELHEEKVEDKEEMVVQPSAVEAVVEEQNDDDPEEEAEVEVAIEKETEEKEEEELEQERSTTETQTVEVKEVPEESWRDMISREPGARFAPEANRYHLYVSHACPWAHRTVLVVALKGLEDIIGITYVHPTWQYTKPEIDEHRGWVFGSKEGKSLTSTSGSGSFPSSWGDEDPNMGAKTIRDIYESVNDTTERYILPVLWDKKLNTIVSNESSEIIRMLNSEFNEFADNPDLDLYPESLAAKIDEINQWIYPSFNNGVYRCGLASTQECYDVAIDELTEAFDKIDSILQSQRYIAGDIFTEADVRLFVTLVRFDEVYDIYFKTNTRSVASTPAVLNYVRDIYQMKNVSKTCVMDMIKAHYYTSHVELNKYSIIPRGVDFIGLLDKPHNRASLS